MSKHDGIISTTIRLDTNTFEGRKAYDFLRESRKAKQGRSYSEIITRELSKLYDRQNQLQRDPYLETREKEDAFAAWIQEMIQTAIYQAEANGIRNLLQLVQGGIGIGNENQNLIGMSVPAPAVTAENKGNDTNDRSYDFAAEFLSTWGSDIDNTESDEI